MLNDGNASPLRVFLSAEWRDLVMLNYEVRPELLGPYVPRGVEIDSYEGKTYLSLVGLRFARAKVFGSLTIPFHTAFDEVNLRFYVKRQAEEGLRRGVVFIREIVGLPAVALTARAAYGENYSRFPMRHAIRNGGSSVSIEYQWRQHAQWNRLYAEAGGEPALPPEGSLEQFIAEHYWGYVKRAGDSCTEYRVSHAQWRLLTASVAAIEPMNSSRGEIYNIAIAAFFLVLALGIRSQAPESKSGVVHVEMQNVVFHFTDRFAAHIFYLQGVLTPTHQGVIPTFDDKNSFELSLESAKISIACDALATVLNQNVFAAADSPLKYITISAEGGLLKIKGRLHSKADVPFELDGSVALTPAGEIEIRTQKIKALHVPVKGILDLLGVNFSAFIDTNKIRGIRTDGNDLRLDAEELLPPPHVKGRISQIHLEGQRIVLLYGKGEPEVFAKSSRNYMIFRGGNLRFGKLTMSDTDLTLIDMDQQDPFDFSIDHYKDQLVAGYSKTTPSFGLRVFMKDFNKLPKSSRKVKPG